MPSHNTTNNPMKRLSIEFVLLLISAFLCAAHSQDSDPFILIHPEDLWVMPNQPATLKCKAVGTEPIQITWYHDGKLVKTLTEDPQSNKMVLPIGHLVFVHVRLNKNGDNNEVKDNFNTNRVNLESDIGNYYCNASNPLTNKFALSNVASVKLAVLENEFEKQPKDIKVEPGEDAVFTCLPPKGEPPPEVKWRKDGIELEAGLGYDGEDERTLVVPAVEKQDAGTYSCVAFNEAGERESRVATLVVKEKPRLVQGPRDTEVKEGSDVVMDCIIRGDPAPQVTWFKNDHKALGDRFTVLEDNSLKIKKVKLQDQGTYKCFGENPDGNISVEAKLTVQTIPIFLVSPGSKVIGKGRDASFACQAAGNPQPAVFWKIREGSTILPENQQGPYEVLKDGTLFIRAVVPKDAGNYMCQALSPSGDAISIASLVVKEIEDTLPPMLGFLPQNQTLPAGATGVFSCSVASRRPTGFDGDDDGDGMNGKLIWMKNGRALVMENEERMYLDNKGYLVVEDLQRSDSGTYTCNLYNKYADYSWSSFLNVISNVHVTNGGAETIFVAPEPTTYPMLSSKPYVTDVTENSLKVVWKDSIYAPPADEYFFHVELFSFSRGKGWEVLATDVTHNWFVAKNLEPNTLYSFVIRVKTPLLIGPPTQPTQPIKTKGSQSSRPAQGISNHRCNPINSTAVNVTWNPTSNTVFDGFKIKYNFIGYAHAENNKNDKLMQKHGNRIDKNTLSTSWPEVTIHSPKKTWIVLSGLKKHATYLYYVESFLRNANKQFAKNLANFTTLEDAPSGTPQHIHPVLLNNTLLRLQWQPPLISEANGHILGYKIKLTLNDSSLVKEMQVNNSVTSMLFFNLLPFKSYQVQIAAFTKAGSGPYNSPVFAKWQNEKDAGLFDSSKSDDKAVYNPNINSRNIYSETWFLGVIVALIGCCIWIASCLFCFLFYRRRKHANNSSTSSTSSACRKPDKLAETQKLMPVINSAYLKNTNNINTNNNNVNENYNPILKKNSFDEDASRQQKDQQSSNNMASSGKLCNNCNNTLIASCCYNHCVSDIECSRMNNNNNNNNNVINYNNNNNNNIANFNNNNDTNNIQSTFYQHSPNQLYHTLAPTFDPNSNNNSSSDHSSNTYGNLIGLQQQLQQKQQQLKQQQIQHQHLQQQQKHLQMLENIPPALPSYQLSPQPHQITPPSQHYPPQNQQHLEQQRQNLQHRLLQQQMLPQQHPAYLADQPSFRSIPDGSFNQLYNEQDEVVPPVLFIPPPPPSEELAPNNDNSSSNIDNIPRKFGTLGKNNSSSSGNKLLSNNISKNMMEKNKKLLNTVIYSDEDNETCPDVKSSLYPSSSSSSSSSLNDKSIEEFGNRKKTKKNKKFNNDIKSNNHNNGHLLYLTQNFQEDTEYEIDDSYKDSSVCQSDTEMIPQYYNNNKNNNENNSNNNDDDNVLNNHATNKTRLNNNERNNNYDNIAPYNNTSGMVKVDKMLNNYNDYDYINNYSFETSLAPKLSDI